MGRQTCKEDRKTNIKFWYAILKGRDRFGNLDTDEANIIKTVLNRDWSGRGQTPIMTILQRWLRLPQRREIS